MNKKILMVSFTLLAVVMMATPLFGTAHACRPRRGGLNEADLDLTMFWTHSELLKEWTCGDVTYRIIHNWGEFPPWGGFRVYEPIDVLGTKGTFENWNLVRIAPDGTYTSRGYIIFTFNEVDGCLKAVFQSDGDSGTINGWGTGGLKRVKVRAEVNPVPPFTWVFKVTGTIWYP